MLGTKPSRQRVVALVGAGPGRRALARVVLGGMLAALLAVAGLPLGLSLAQVQPKIQLINPTAGTSFVVTDKQQEYRIVSWVNELPPNAHVEYQVDVTRVPPIDPNEDGTIDLGAAVQSGNAFDLLWDIPDGLPESTTSGATEIGYVLRAILYRDYTGPGTGVAVAQDEQPITINHKEDPDPTQHSPEDAGESVQITYPENGGPVGVYIKQSGDGGNLTIETIASRHTRFLRPFYTLTQPGEEPVWKSCGIPGGRLALIQEKIMFRITIQCVIQPGDYALDVTGVAVVTNDTPSPTPAGQAQAIFNDGADASMVTPYFQRAERITIDHPTTDAVETEFGCPKLVATVLDQNDRPIGNMNVDLHIQGPTDQVRFGTIFPAPDANNLNKPPDRSHPRREPAQSCLSGPKEGLSGQQADHNVSAGLDTKHIESSVGTDMAGTFMFAVTSGEVGATRIAVWADEDDDDLFCDQEVAGYASVGWGPTVAPPPTGLPHDTSVCPDVPIPPPSPGPTPSASGGSPTATGDPNTFDREIDMRFGHAPLIVSGNVSGGPDECTEDIRVKVQRMKDGRFVTIEQTTTDDIGRYQVEIRDRTGRYRAVATRARFNEVVCRRATITNRHTH